ncbi:MAG: trehalose-6-phosphate synthase [Bifidobacteriaceae bacterium]|jgi:alpha,alpha-trehalose-phosphate synthase [UDP-forming]|nr:trehalose-6-phosphate synthase [Bifidobacteriaceae bacterium]
MDPGQFDLVVVANRLPVDAVIDDDGAVAWRRSPGGLVAALEPALGSHSGAWVGWPGAADLDLEPFDADGIATVPVPVSESEVAEYYEGFSNATIWPLYHDVITPPESHREWAEAYRTVNRRFAIAAARAAAPGATVWIHDYQLQLVPRMLRSLRPDVRVGFFLHIPFPGVDLFSQLPWRKEILEGVLGADLIGFQRAADASNFRRAVRRLTGLPTHGTTILATSPSAPPRAVRALPFPISIDFDAIDATARREDIQQRALAIREELGNPDVVFLGADRLDYTKGIRHRLKAFGELVASGDLTVPGAILVQVASPTRDNVVAYQELRDEVDTTVGRINGDFGTLTQVAVQYLHQAQPFEEMVALYLAADVVLVTALRDGMNLVAKEYVAACWDHGGVLVLSEFAGAADELSQAIIVNPHDIDAMKESILRAANMPATERRRRMRALRRRVKDRDVAYWASSFLGALEETP